MCSCRTGSWRSELVDLDRRKRRSCGSSEQASARNGSTPSLLLFLSLMASERVRRTLGDRCGAHVVERRGCDDWVSRHISTFGNQGGRASALPSRASDVAPRLCICRSDQYRSILVIARRRRKTDQRRIRFEILRHASRLSAGRRGRSAPAPEEESRRRESARAYFAATIKSCL